MDGSAFRNFNFGGLIWWALFGMVAAAGLAFCALAYAVYWAVHHIQIV